MRRIPVYLVTLTLFSTLAGSLEAQGTALGIRLGLNRADVTASRFGRGVDSRMGFAAGAFVSLAQAGRLIVQPEVLYSQKGFGSLVQGGTATANFSYVEVPLLFKIRLSDQSRRLRPAAILGSYLAFEAGCSLSGELDGIGGDSDCDTLFAGRGEMDAGLVLGLGADYGLVERFFITADVRYTLGLLNIDWEEADERIAHRVWTLMLGIGVHLGR